MKVAGSRNDCWSLLSNGILQDAILGPFIFNIFINCFVLNLQSVNDISNYADDNTGGVSANSTEEVWLKLKNYTQDMLHPYFCSLKIV